MGFDLFKKVNTLIDFNTKNTDVDRIFNIAGKINTEWFGVVVDYHNASYSYKWNEAFLAGTLYNYEPPEERNVRQLRPFLYTPARQ